MAKVVLEGKLLCLNVNSYFKCNFLSLIFQPSRVEAVSVGPVILTFRWNVVPSFSVSSSPTRYVLSA